jgi:prepilin-type processing-associated H-X9-DG protein/prepilin-type N-terminal cleavage/methylation domain-containing protein
MRLPRPQYRLKAFTLVELLVVMGIIAILVTISFGAITSMIKAGQAGKCAGNMRQIGIAFQGYLGDNNNVMPQRVYAADNNLGYFNLLAPYSGGSTNDKSSTIFVCPSHSTCSFPAEPSYGMNWYYDNTSVLAVTELSTTIMAAESAGVVGQGSNRADENSLDPGELDTTRHNGVSNYLFFDGHVEKLAYAATTNMWGTNMNNPPDNPHNLPAPQ